MVNDSIADLLTQILNAIRRKRETVEIPASRLKQEIAEILKSEGYLTSVERAAGKGYGTLRLRIRYIAEDQAVITGLKRVSRPGRRIYVGRRKVPSVQGRTGLALVSTPQGILTDRECRARKIGGEVLCYVW
jgi:small subunit ribosomal protein S8